MESNGEAKGRECSGDERKENGGMLAGLHRLIYTAPVGHVSQPQGRASTRRLYVARPWLDTAPAARAGEGRMRRGPS